MSSLEGRSLNPEAEQTPLSPEAEAFYENAYRRITRVQIGLLFIGALLGWWIFGRWIALSFLLGGAIAALNFFWLKRLVMAFTERIVSSGDKRSGGSLVSKFLLRYGLVAAGAYVIFKSSALSLYGLFAGLSLPAAAIFCEAVYELYVSLRKGF